MEYEDEEEEGTEEEEEEEEEDDEEEEEEDGDVVEVIPAVVSPRVLQSHDAVSNSLGLTGASGKGAEMASSDGGDASDEDEGGDCNIGEIEGLFCPICMEAWTNGGDHQICCLPCGHIYGLSCIKKWLQQRRSSAKCPQCNKKSTLKDVRVLYASRICVVDEELQKHVRSLEAKCTSLKKKNADHLKKEVDWKKKEADLWLQVHQLTDRTKYLEGLLEDKSGKLSEPFTGILCDERSAILGQNRAMESGNQGCSRSFTSQISLIAPHERDNIPLPSNAKAVRDIHVSPHDHLALLAFLGKKLVILSTESNNTVLSYDLPAAAWSCSWDINSSHHMYTGLQNGMLLAFDMRQTRTPMESRIGLTCNPIHTVHSVPPDSTFPSGITTVLSASSVGLSEWNIGVADERRPVLIPGSENQGVCISLACSHKDDVVASFRPKVEISNNLAVSQSFPSPSTSRGVQGSHIVFKRIGGRVYRKVGSTVSIVNEVRLPKSAIIERTNHSALFAFPDEMSGNLVLQDLSSLRVFQHLKANNVIRDIRYRDIGSRGLLGCLTDNALEVFTLG